MGPSAGEDAPLLAVSLTRGHALSMRRTSFTSPQADPTLIGAVGQFPGLMLPNLKQGT